MKDRRIEIMRKANEESIEMASREADVLVVVTDPYLLQRQLIMGMWENHHIGRDYFDKTVKDTHYLHGGYTSFFTEGNGRLMRDVVRCDMIREDVKLREYNLVIAEPDTRVLSNLKHGFKGNPLFLTYGLISPDTLTDGYILKPNEILGYNSLAEILNSPTLWKALRGTERGDYSLIKKHFSSIVLNEEAELISRKVNRRIPIMTSLDRALGESS